MRKRYTASAEKVLENAGKEAVSRGMSYVGTEHLLLALIKTKGVAAEVLRENAVNAESLEEMIQDRTVKRNGVYCSPFAGNGWDQPAEIVYGFVDRSRTGYEYCEK